MSNMEGYGKWFDAEDLPSVRITVLLAVRRPEDLPEDGFLALGGINDAKEWSIEVSIRGDEEYCQDGWVVMKWTPLPDYPFPHVIDEDEPILLKNGDVLDPATKEVVNHVPMPRGISDMPNWLRSGRHG